MPGMKGRWARKDRFEPVVRLAGGYALLAALATALCLLLRDGLPWTHPDPWLPLTRTVSLSTSALLGLSLATGVILLTRVAVARSVRARRLHCELRPVARDFTLGQILLVAGLSSLGEELLFRGLLVPALGIVASAVLFGLAHQIKGPSRWVWVGWAAAVGGALGLIFALTGSLVGPLIAHAVVNAVNLTYLRDHDPAAAGGESRFPA
jgi:uncharacterized protein